MLNILYVEIILYYYKKNQYVLNKSLTSGVLAKILDFKKKLICQLIKSGQRDSLSSGNTTGNVLRNTVHRLPRRCLHYKYHKVLRYTSKCNFI
jgi:hypothetical protein